MYDFSQARTHMMDSQILTSGVISPAVVDAFQTVPREIFIPEQYQGVAYQDEDIEIAEGRYLMEPMVHAKILEALKPKSTDIVLDIACGSGYSAAILSSIVTTVVALESHKDMIDHAQNMWNAHDMCNIVTIEGDITKGSPENAPYNIIIINGAVSEVPKDILDQLAPDGQLVTIVKGENEVMGHVTLFKRNGELNEYSSHALFSAGCPHLPELAPKPAFKF